MADVISTWEQLRSDIYIRDKGICWVCNGFVELRDYDLGHLIDKCNGGAETYDNLAVMHSACNSAKPRHTTLEDAMRWKLTPTFVDRGVVPLEVISPPRLKRLLPPPSTKIGDNYHHRGRFTKKDREAIKALVLEYFSSRPELLEHGDGYNLERIRATSQLAEQLGIGMGYIRVLLREAGLVKKRPPQVTDGSQYRFVYEHLDELLSKYEGIKKQKVNLYDQPKLMGMSVFQMDIMFYLAGKLEKVSRRNYGNISRRVSLFGMAIRLNEPTLDKR